MRRKGKYSKRFFLGVTTENQCLMLYEESKELFLIFAEDEVICSALKNRTTYCNINFLTLVHFPLLVQQKEDVKGSPGHTTTVYFTELNTVINTNCSVKSDIRLHTYSSKYKYRNETLYFEPSVITGATEFCSTRSKFNAILMKPSTKPRQC